MTDSYPNARDCKHGSLARSCDLCDLLANVGRLIKERDQGEALWGFCQQFIKAQRISCPESVYQSDRVILNAYEFIEGVCEIVGYYEYEEEQDDG